MNNGGFFFFSKWTERPCVEAQHMYRVGDFCPRSNFNSLQVAQLWALQGWATSRASKNTLAIDRVPLATPRDPPPRGLFSLSNRIRDCALALYCCCCCCCCRSLRRVQLHGSVQPSSWSKQSRRHAHAERSVCGLSRIVDHTHHRGELQ